MAVNKKMYWKSGFFDYPIKDCVEISVEYWQELLDGQSAGKLIVTNDDGYPILVEHEYTIDELKEMKIAEINAYDKSDAVNSFTLAGKEIWLDKDTRQLNRYRERIRSDEYHALVQCREVRYSC